MLRGKKTHWNQDNFHFHLLMRSSDTPLKPVTLTKACDRCKADGNSVFLSHYESMCYQQCSVLKKKMAVKQPRRGPYVFYATLKIKVEQKQWLAFYGPRRQQWHTWSHRSVHQQRQACHGMSRVIKLDGHSEQPDLTKKSSYKTGKNYNVGLTFSWHVKECQAVHLTSP